jgi:hypothetical protein
MADGGASRAWYPGDIWTSRDNMAGSNGGGRTHHRRRVTRLRRAQPLYGIAATSCFHRAYARLARVV